MNRKEPNRRIAGFTLAKVMITMAIIVILAAVSVPAVFFFQKQLIIKELNTCAKELFFAAQNNLTGLKDAGTLETLSVSDGGIDNQGYLTPDSADLPLVLPQGAVDPSVTEGHYYIIVLETDTGAVREVFYTEDTRFPEALLSLGGPENSWARRSAKVGYYSGEALTAGSAEPLPQVTIDVLNDEVLSAEFTVPTEFREHTRLTVSIAALDGSGSAILVAGEDARLPAPDLVSGKTTLVLDRLDSPFSQTFSESDMTPGADLQITALLEYTGNDKYLIPSSAYSTVNSLFASRTGGEVQLSCCRHLQNLHNTYLGASTKDPVTAAVQTADIDWTRAKDATGKPIPFTPIESPELLRFDGGNFAIKNISLALAATSNADSYAGLFRTFGTAGSGPTASLANIRLVNMNITCSRWSGYVGALAATATRTTITNCLVYREPDKASAIRVTFADGGHHTNFLVGGLVGLAENCTIQSCGVGLDLIDVSHTAASIGGLVGSAKGVTNLSYSYAAVTNLRGEADSIGLFAGSFVESHNKEKNAYKVDHCYSVGNLDGTIFSGGTPASLPSGFAGGDCENVSFKYAYTAATYLDEQGAALSTDVNLFSAGGNKNICAALKPNTAGLSAEDASLSLLSFSQLTEWMNTNSTWTHLKDAQSHSYQDARAGAYPFPVPVPKGKTPLDHYGSWPEPFAVQVGGRLCYYETYAGNRIGYFSIADDGSAFNNLSNEYNIESWGYGVITEQDADVSSLVVSGYNPISNPFNQNGHIALTGTKQVIWMFSDSAIEYMKTTLMTNTSTGAELTVGSDRYFINPLFAAAIAPADKASILATTQRPLQVRTQSQLANLTFAPYAKNAYYKQSRDITLSDWTPLSYVLDQGGIYDGAGFRILKADAPIFERVQNGVLENVIIENANIRLDIDMNNAGILAIQLYDNPNIVRNCVVRNSSISATGNLKVAGFVGRNGSQSTISGCEVNNLTIRATGNASSAAGFVGENHGTITDSCVAPDKTGKGYSSVTISAAAGDASGFVDTNNGSISECFAVGTVSANSGAASGFARFNSDLASAVIERSYANSMIDGQSASGFLSGNSGRVKDCYSLLKITGGSASKNAVAGFCSDVFSGSVQGTMTNCYTAVLMEGGKGENTYAFSANSTSNKAVNCFYLKQGETQDASDAAGLDYDQMCALLTDGKLPSQVWTTSGSSSPFSMSGKYPFPQLLNVIHVGNWPERPAVNTPVPEEGTDSSEEAQASQEEDPVAEEPDGT